MMKKFKNTPPKSESLKADPAKTQPTKTDSSKVFSTKLDAPKAGRVSFELIKPDAKNVCVAGSFNDWKPEKAPLVPMGNGRWVGDLAVKPGRYEYLFVVDGQWMPDPNAKETVQNPFGGRNSILGVSE
jgi:1,4-alpha-glucan branching enzyme